MKKVIKKVITKKMVRDCRRLHRCQWHDQAWWSATTTDIMQAIESALDNRQYGDTDKDICADAEDFLKILTDQK